MAMALRSLAVRRPGGATLLSILSSASRRPTSSFSTTLFRPLSAVAEPLRFPLLTRRRLEGFRCFSVSRTSSSLNDSSPNWSNRPPKETILLDGCDFEHWLVVVEPPDSNLTRDEIIKSYIKTLAQVVGSEEEARFKIYSVSTKHYFAFGALVSEELSYKIKELPGVRWVLPDSYLDVKNKDYGGEPFINGEAVPYDPKYHEEWVRNNARAMERNRRNDRPRNMDRSRNFERRRENMQNFQNRAPPPPPPIQTQDLGNQSNQTPNPPHMPGQGPIPPPMPGQSPQNVSPPSFPGQGPPPNMPNAGGPNYGSYQSRLPGAHQGPPMPGSHPGPAPPMPGSNSHQGPPMPGSHPGPAPPMPSSNSHQGMPPRSAPNYGAPNRDFGGFQNPAPNYQNGPPPANPRYTGGGVPNSYQGGSLYQGVGNVYQGGPPGYQGGPTGYQGPPNPYQGNPGPYQAPPSNTYQGNAGGGNSRQGEGGDGGPYQEQSEPDRRY